MTDNLWKNIASGLDMLMDGVEIQAFMRKIPQDYARQLADTYDTLRTVEDAVNLTRKKAIQDTLAETVTRMEELSKGFEVAIRYVSIPILAELKESLDERIADYK